MNKDKVLQIQENAMASAGRYVFNNVIPGSVFSSFSLLILSLLIMDLIYIFLLLTVQKNWSTLWKQTKFIAQLLTVANRGGGDVWNFLVPELSLGRVESPPPKQITLTNFFNILHKDPLFTTSGEGVISNYPIFKIGNSEKDDFIGKILSLMLHPRKSVKIIA